MMQLNPGESAEVMTALERESQYWKGAYCNHLAILGLKIKQELERMQFSQPEIDFYAQENLPPSPTVADQLARALEIRGAYLHGLSAQERYRSEVSQERHRAETDK